LYSIRLKKGGKRIKYVGFPPKGQKFDVKSFYHALSSLVGSSFSWKSIWRGKDSLRGIFCVDYGSCED
jgi:hypothetical protein